MAPDHLLRISAGVRRIGGHITGAASDMWPGDIARIVDDREIDLVVPPFRDRFFMARYADRVPAPFCVPSFETVAQLYNKATFQVVCHRLDLPAPKTHSVTTCKALRAAIAEFEEFVARPAFSRAGETTVDDCNPTEDNSWPVQEYIHGDAACSCSILRNGTVVVHAVYEPTIAADGGFSVQFVSIGDFGTLEMTSRVTAELEYYGFVGFDVWRTGDAFVTIECNLRLTAGAFLMPENWLTEVVTATPGGSGVNTMPSSWGGTRPISVRKRCCMSC